MTRFALNASIEMHLNAYEEACAKYLDDKVDKTRFQRNYEIEIRNLFGDTTMKPYLDSVNSPYHCLQKVYRLWNNRESSGR